MNELLKDTYIHACCMAKTRISIVTERGPQVPDTVTYLQVCEQVASDAAAGQHALHGLLHDALGNALHSGTPSLKTAAATKSDKALPCCEHVIHPFCMSRVQPLKRLPRHKSMLRTSKLCHLSPTMLRQGSSGLHTSCGVPHIMQDAIDSLV